jgi:hypothetical protein
MRPTARKRIGAVATIAIKIEIGRGNPNNTKFTVPAPPLPRLPTKNELLEKNMNH